MIFDKTRDEFVLSSGRRFYANKGLLSVPLPGDREGVTLYEGYDGSVFEDDEAFTPEERLEIAEHQIALWRAWASRTP